MLIEHADPVGPDRCQPDASKLAPFPPCSGLPAICGRDQLSRSAVEPRYFNDLRWCCRWVSNLRPLPYQGSALPLSYGSIPVRRSSRRRRKPIHEGPTASKVGGSRGRRPRSICRAPGAPPRVERPAVPPNHAAALQNRVDPSVSSSSVIAEHVTDEIVLVRAAHDRLEALRRCSPFSVRLTFPSSASLGNIASLSEARGRLWGCRIGRSGNGARRQLAAVDLVINRRSTIVHRPHPARPRLQGGQGRASVGLYPVVPAPC